MHPSPSSQPSLDTGMNESVATPDDREALTREIHELECELNDVILAHNYQVPEIRDVVDFVRNSLGPAQQAPTTGAGVVVRPESLREVRERADTVCSTESMKFHE